MPPVGQAVHQTFAPDQIDLPLSPRLLVERSGAIFCYAGAHRLLDKGAVGPENIDEVAELQPKVLWL